MKKVRWGVLGTARIGIHSVIPAIAKTANAEVFAIASRSADKARTTAFELGIPKAFGSYEELLACPDVDVVYNPLPNHLHVPWSLEAMKSGKHVLIEKPAALAVSDALRLVKARDKAGVLAGEAFMVRSHLQWRKVLDFVQTGGIGRLVCVQGHFSFFLDNPFDIRNKPEWGGGGMWDLGCYPVTTSRMLFGEEPRRVVCTMDPDPTSGVDRLSSAILEFPSGHSVFTAGIGHSAYQRMVFFGTKKRIEIEIPFNAPGDVPCKVGIFTGDLAGADREELGIPVCNQYVRMVEEFSDAVLGKGSVPVPLEETLKNTIVMESLFRSARTGVWVDIRPV
jgi:predicted dehydrogenase